MVGNITFLIMTFFAFFDASPLTVAAVVNTYSHIGGLADRGGARCFVCSNHGTAVDDGFPADHC